MKLDSPLLHLGLCALAFLQNDAAGIAHEAGWAIGKPGVEGEIIYFEADLRLCGTTSESQHIDPTGDGFDNRCERKGDRGEARSTSSAVRIPLREGRPSAQGSYHCFANFRGPRCRGRGTIALALAGDTPKARRLAEDLAKRFPEDTLVQFDYCRPFAVPSPSSNAASKPLRSSRRLLLTNWDPSW